MLGQRNVQIKFQVMKYKLPPIRQPLLLVDVAGKLYAGEYIGKGREYDFIHNIWIKGSRVHLWNAESIDRQVIHIGTTLPIQAWALVPDQSAMKAAVQ